jgi:hypothetical protein
MVAARRVPPHWIITGVGVGVLALVWILAGTDVLSLGASAWACAIISAFILLTHLLIALLNPNLNRSSNHAQAQDRLRAGRIWTPPNAPVNPGAPAPPTGLSWVGWALFGMMFLCVFAAAWPELLRGINGWPVNDKWSPPMAGPGDSAYIYLPATVTSVNGYWNGTADAWADAVGDPTIVNRPLRASTSNQSWGTSISVEGSPNGTKTLWARVYLPRDDDRLVGKTLRLRIQLHIISPKYFPPDGTGKAHFEDMGEDPPLQQAELKVGPPGCGASYRASWYGGVLGGGLALAILGAMLALEAGSLRRLALPTEVFVPEKPTTY